jgi:hypothetical protein
MDNAVLGRGPQPGSPVTEIVGVRSREHGGIPSPRCERRQTVVELRFAVVAAVAVVLPVALAFELCGRDRLVPDTDRAGDVTRSHELSGRERR